MGVEVLRLLEQLNVELSPAGRCLGGPWPSRDRAQQLPPQADSVDSSAGSCVRTVRYASHTSSYPLEGKEVPGDLDEQREAASPASEVLWSLLWVSASLPSF